MFSKLLHWVLTLSVLTAMLLIPSRSLAAFPAKSTVNNQWLARFVGGPDWQWNQISGESEYNWQFSSDKPFELDWPGFGKLHYGVETSPGSGQWKEAILDRPGFITVTKADFRFNPETSVPPAQSEFFPQTGYKVRGAFYFYWRDNGGLAIFGLPITGEFPEWSYTENKAYTVQYFERNRFEYHPEFAGTPNQVLLGLLGHIALQANYPGGAPQRCGDTWIDSNWLATKVSNGVKGWTYVPEGNLWHLGSKDGPNIRFTYPGIGHLTLWDPKANKPADLGPGTSPGTSIEIDQANWACGQ